MKCSSQTLSLKNSCTLLRSSSMYLHGGFLYECQYVSMVIRLKILNVYKGRNTVNSEPSLCYIVCYSEHTAH